MSETFSADVGLTFVLPFTQSQQMSHFILYWPYLTQPKAKIRNMIL